MSAFADKLIRGLVRKSDRRCDAYVDFARRPAVFQAGDFNNPDPPASLSALPSKQEFDAAPNPVGATA